MSLLFVFVCSLKPMESDVPSKDKKVVRWADKVGQDLTEDFVRPTYYTRRKADSKVPPPVPYEPVLTGITLEIDRLEDSVVDLELAINKALKIMVAAENLKSVPDEEERGLRSQEESNFRLLNSTSKSCLRVGVSVEVLKSNIEFFYGLLQTVTRSKFKFSNSYVSSLKSLLTTFRDQLVKVVNDRVERINIRIGELRLVEEAEHLLEDVVEEEEESEE